MGPRARDAFALLAPIAATHMNNKKTAIVTITAFLVGFALHVTNHVV
jgi:hypothetical protein